MANEILYNTIGDLRLAEVLAGEYDRLITERVTLPQHPALRYIGVMSRRGSTTVKVPLLGVGGYDVPALTAEGVDVDNTALTDDKVTLALGQYSLAREASDLARLTSPNGDITPETFAMDVIEGRSKLMVSLTADIVDGFTSVLGGGAGADLTLVDFLEAKTMLRGADVQGELMSMLSTRQWGDVLRDVGTVSGGALQMDPDALQLLRGGGYGYEGRYLGVDVFITNQVKTNAGAALGGMWGAGGVYWGDSEVIAESPDQLVLGGRILYERERKARKAQTAWISHTWLAFSKGQDAAGVTISSDE